MAELNKKLRALAMQIEDECNNTSCSHFFGDDECRLCMLKYLSTHNRLREDLLSPTAKP